MGSIRLPDEVWLQVFELLSKEEDTITCALVCKSWCLLVRDTIDDVGARDLVHPSSFSYLKRLHLTPRWLQPCLTFILSIKRKFLALKEIEIHGMTYSHHSDIQTALKYVNRQRLKRVVFVNPQVALEKYAPKILTAFPNITVFKTVYDNDGFTRRTLSSTGYLKAQDFNITTLQVRLKDQGFEETATNAFLVKQLVTQSPLLRNLFLDPYSSPDYHSIIKYCTENCKHLEVLSMARERTISTLLADPDLRFSDESKQKGLRMYVATEVMGPKHDYTGGIGEANLTPSQNTLEILYLESLTPSKFVTWTNVLPYGEDWNGSNDIEFPKLRYLTMHLGRDVRNTTIPTSDLEDQICRTLSHSHLLESFTYRRAMDMRYYIERTRIADRTLESLERNCPKLRTFRVTGCYDFSDLKLHQFFQTFALHLSVVEFDCTIKSTNLSYILQTLKNLRRINLHHVCRSRYLHECPFAGDAGDIFSAWDGTFTTSHFMPINVTYYYDIVP